MSFTSEQWWEKKLNIRTKGKIDHYIAQDCNPYEPTDYRILQTLAESGYITADSHVLDYGCGKGRVSFFLSYQLRCRSVGIEYDDRIYGAAVENRMSAVSGERVELVLAKAEDFAVPQAADRMFFFNPFSVEILKSVVNRILESWYENPGEIFLFFYYPSDEYVSYLMTVDELMFVDEIDCRNLFGRDDSRERIMVFGVE